MRIRFRSVLLTIMLLIFAPLNGCAYEHPSDQALIENFQTHKTEFNQLLQMFLTDDALISVAFDWTDPKEPQTIGITQERLDAYRRLFRKLGLPKGISGYGGKNRILFFSSTRGLGVSGSGKGYAYVKEPPELVVDNLDNYKSKDGKSFTAYKHIEGNWYLFFDFTA